MHEKDYLQCLTVISAANARVAGMTAENMQRQMLGQSMAYTDSDFEYEAKNIENVYTTLKFC